MESLWRISYDNAESRDLADNARLIQMLDAQNAYRCNQQIKRVMLELLDVQPGDAVLDVGAGTGDDTRGLARLASPDGSAVGIDANPVMLAEAQRRAEDQDLEITFQLGDVQNLPFPDATFDRVWSERTFLWLADPYLAFREVVRVTRPGGRIVISTYDINSSVRGGYEPELNARLERMGHDHFPSPAIGRELPVMFHEAGLTDIAVRPQLVEHEMTGPASPQHTVTRARVDLALSNGTFTPEEAERYLRSFEQAVENGLFFTLLYAFVVAGTKPV